VADEISTDANTNRSVAEYEKNPKGIVQRWIAELEAAHKAEGEWRTEARKMRGIYEGDEESAFNIMWSNTETILPSVYNSTPVPDVRRRFRDADPLAKMGCKVIDRALTYELDQYDFDWRVKLHVLDAELIGRGVGRIKYKPAFAAMAKAKPSLWQAIKGKLGAGQDGQQQAADVLVDELCELELVQWDMFRRGPGKTWDDVTWVGFAHDLSYDDAAELLGKKIADDLKYTDAEGADDWKAEKGAKALFATCRVWEIWDKHKRRVLFIAECVKEKPLKVLDDPLRLAGFFPMARPIYTIKNSSSLIPRSRYKMYQRQAESLERISVALDRTVKALRMRGAYAKTAPEIAGILEADTGDMIAIENLSAIIDGGGLDKMIWLMPIERLKAVVDALILARNECKQAIYEIMGLSDIMRGSTDPNETLGAQELKAQTGSVRLEDYKGEIQRYVRDVLRIKAEIICEHFSIETLQTITQLAMPDDQQKAMAQQVVHNAQLAQQEPPEEAVKLLEMPTWQEVLELLQSDFMRGARIDIETDSTVAETLNRDVSGIVETTNTLGTVLGAALPLVQSGMMPLEAAKQLGIQLVRRGRMGQPLEDALEEMQQPAPEAQPGAEGDGGAAALAAEKAKSQGEIQRLKTENDAVKQQMELQKREFDLQLREAKVEMAEQALQREQQQLQQQARAAEHQLAQREAALTTIGAGQPDPGMPGGGSMNGGGPGGLQ
jgi:hypothetical protein